jgi:hypothetical protein
MPQLHPGQTAIRRSPARFKVLACGRRWGKTRLGAALCLETGLAGGAAWWVAPSYKVAAVGWRQIKGLAAQVPGAVVREGDRKADLPGGGWIQVRSADFPDSLRGEGLDRVVLDECAFVAEGAWSESIRPALSDRKGDALLISTPKGRNWFWRLWTKGQGVGGEWASWRFPSVSNPHLDPAEVEAARLDLPERVYQQEYRAEFLEESGGVFRRVPEAIDRGRSANEVIGNGRPVTLGVDLARVEDFTVLCGVDDAGRQVYFERFNQISWERQIAAIADAAKCLGARVVVDSTGVGDPIYERLTGLCDVLPFKFTAQSKEQAIDRLAMKLERGELRLLDVPAQENELLAYQYELTPTRHVRMNAPAGMHDDTVIALALACWGEGYTYSAGAY